jgi:hypothetical protein
MQPTFRRSRLSESVDSILAALHLKAARFSRWLTLCTLNKVHRLALESSKTGSRGQPEQLVQDPAPFCEKRSIRDPLGGAPLAGQATMTHATVHSSATATGLLETPAGIRPVLASSMPEDRRADKHGPCSPIHSAPPVKITEEMAGIVGWQEACKRFQEKANSQRYHSVSNLYHIKEAGTSLLRQGLSTRLGLHPMFSKWLFVMRR